MQQMDEHNSVAAEEYLRLKLKTKILENELIGRGALDDEEE